MLSAARGVRLTAPKSRHASAGPSTLTGMGLFRRAAEQSSSSFWSMAANVMRPDEEPVDYAHLRCQSGREDLPGTLFLTSKQVIWRAVAPGVPKGAGFEVAIEDLIAAGPVASDPSPGVFGLGMELQGQQGMLVFRPQRQRSDASIEHAERMLEQIQAARRAAGSRSRTDEN